MSNAEGLGGVLRTQQPAGRELDALIAERVMGYTRETRKVDWYPVEISVFYKDPSWLEYSYDERSCNAMMFRNGVDASDGHAAVLPYYSASIESAWSVVEKMAGDWPDFTLRHIEEDQPEDGWYARFRSTQRPGYGQTAPEAICRAALIVVAAEGTP